MTSHPTSALRHQHGLSLVELLVALTLSTLIALAGVASLTVARQGINSVDASSQLEDNARFATSLMRRLIVQTGYLEEKYAMDFGSEFKMGAASDIEPNLKGFNDALYNQALVIGTSTTPSASLVNGSDMLVLRYQAGETAVNSGVADQTMINCSGGTATVTAAINATDRMVSVFHVATSAQTGEPSLMCTWVNDAGTWSTQPLIEGVESMQILYGVDGVTASAAPTAVPDSVPEAYLRADQLTAPSNADTLLNWRRVRSVRIGLVLRGPPGSAPESAVPAQYPLGAAGVMDSADDTGSEFAAQTDGRLRQTVTFTVHLRNPQNNV